MRSDRLSETAQDAYTLVLEMSRPEPNIQIAISIVENSPDSDVNLVVREDAPIFTSDFRCEESRTAGPFPSSALDSCLRRDVPPWFPAFAGMTSIDQQHSLAGNAAIAQLLGHRGDVAPASFRADLRPQ
jgi:hypothetical protein